jgi:putative hydrolase of the HAD superfamily
MDKITTISFDADGTLFDFAQVTRHALNCALAELRRAVPARADSLTAETMMAIRNQVAEELRGEAATFEQIRLAAFQRTLQHIGVANDKLAARLYRVYMRHRFEDIELYDDVLPTLDALQGRYILGMLSNGNSYPERCGLGDRFQFTVFSQDHGVEKPDPRIFEIALAQAGCSRQEFLHVGDSLRDDVAGAKAAGVRSVWLNRAGRENNSGIQANVEIKSLKELVDICRQGETSDTENL